MPVTPAPAVAVWDDFEAPCYSYQRERSDARPGRDLPIDLFTFPLTKSCRLAIRGVSEWIHSRTKRFDPHTDDGRKHLRRITKKMHLAARHVEPVDWCFDDFRADTSKRDKKFDVECKSLLMKFAADRFVAFTPYQLKAAL